MNSIKMRCSLEFTVKAVTCPNASHFSASLRPYVHVSIHVFDQRFTTRNVLPSFPLKFYKRFCVSKIFMPCYSFWDIINALAGERIQITLSRVNYSGVSKILSTFESNLIDFLFPESSFLHSYSDFEREIILTPVYPSHFHGIIGPRLQLSVRFMVQEVFGALDKLLDINKKIDSNLTEAELLDNVASKNTCHYSIEKKVEFDQMEDRPPFVVRRVDSKLISRVPSLYKKYEAKRAYCCYSPHRDGQCAACRMENWETQSKHIVQRRPRIPNSSIADKEKIGADRTIQQEKLSPEGLCVSCQQNKMENQQNTHEVPEPIEIMRTSSSPRPFLRSPHVNWADKSAVNAMQRMSPVFNKPTFVERFGNNEVGVKETDTKQKSYHMQTHLDQAQQTDFSYPDKRPEKYAVAPYICRQFNCNYPHLSNYRYENCSCPYCPAYWRHRLDVPLCIPNSRSYWREFHHGLANIYDDLQTFP